MKEVFGFEKNTESGLQDKNFVFSLQFAVFSQNTKIQEKKKIEQSAS